MHHHHSHNDALVVLSVIIAIVASYVALDMAGSLSNSKGYMRRVLLICGSLALGIGIWSMHFVAMLAMDLGGIAIYYDIPLMVLSIVVAIVASSLALSIVGKKSASWKTKLLGSFLMGTAIAGMHYIGIASMRMGATVHWDYFWVVVSILVALVASFSAIILSFKLRNDLSPRGFLNRVLAGVVMGFAIAGMHYSGMMAMHFVPNGMNTIPDSQLIASSAGLTVTVVLGTVIILGIAIWGAAIERELTKRSVINESLEKAVRSRDEFMSIASHELKTPLTSIKLQTQFMLKQMDTLQDGPELERFQRLLKQTDQSVARLSRLVDDMLDISRIANNKLKLQPEEFDLREMVHDVVERLRPYMIDHQIDYKIHACEEIKGVWDRYRLEQVLTNLLTNAIRYGNHQPIEIKISSDDITAYLSVRDQGPGIALTDQERIFQRFERAVPFTEKSGLGLGLFISKEIVLMHGGSIDVKSDLGQGAEFIVGLPKYFQA